VTAPNENYEYRWPPGSVRDSSSHPPEPAAEAVSGNGSGHPVPCAVLDELAVFVRRYVVVAPEQVDALALWIAHTFTYEAFDCSPYLAITSAEKRCGKSRLFDVLELLVARPWRIVSPSEAVVYRKINRDRPTLLLDEVDTIFGRNGEGEPLRALLNAGNRVGVRVPRCAGAQRDKLEEFDVYCPKALAGIGRLPDTIADRAIPLELKRRAPDEPIERFRRRDVEPDALILSARVADWTEPNRDYLAGLRPVLPEELEDRAADAWEPLLALAELAGGKWPDRARRAALALSTVADEDDSLGVRLLADIRRVFEERAPDSIATADLLAALADDEEAPWATLQRGDRPLTARRLASLLSPYKIRPRKWREEGETVRGYRRRDFVDAWGRYLTRHNRHNGSTMPDSADSATATETPSVADEKPSICRDVPGAAGQDAAEELPA
jgi:hypothetical protein